MLIATCNVNGVRSADKKGFFDWLASLGPDVALLQETRASVGQMPKAAVCPGGMRAFFNSAARPGYSGVAAYASKRMGSVRAALGAGLAEFDEEGRWLRLDFDDFDFTAVSLYMPSGSSSLQRQEKKYAAMAGLAPKLKALLEEREHVVVCGDWNIARQEIDLKNHKANVNHSGFLPQERAWMADVLSMGWVDAWRTLYPEVPGYTWWSNRSGAYARDVGWRIDYQLCSPALAKTLVRGEVFKGMKFSDHAPLLMEFGWPA